MRSLTGYHYDYPPSARPFCHFCCFAAARNGHQGDSTARVYLPCTYLDHRPATPPAINKLRPN
ncbi:hypothetical protein CEQ36_18590 [Yersinia intermedia]|nr:hypothetical protein A6J67_05845 [Yersinia sp. FDAARGOS_228]AVL37396.1 hypothetical protein CEQ36_18590 [Yersinia intermedia]